MVLVKMIEKLNCAGKYDKKPPKNGRFDNYGGK